MRIALVIAALALASAQAAAQTSSPPRPVYPIPPVVITTPGGQEVPGHIDTTDRATRCLLYGKSIGVPADQIDDYMKRCVLQ